MKACKANGVCMLWAKTGRCEVNERGDCAYNHTWRRNLPNDSRRGSSTSTPSRQQRGRGARGGRNFSHRSSAQVFNVQDLDEGIFLLDEAQGSEDASGEGDEEEVYDINMLAASESDTPLLVSDSDSDSETDAGVNDARASSATDSGRLVPGLIPSPTRGLFVPALSGGPPPLAGSDSGSEDGSDEAPGPEASVHLGAGPIYSPSRALFVPADVLNLYQESEAAESSTRSQGTEPRELHQSQAPVVPVQFERSFLEDHEEDQSEESDNRRRLQLAKDALEYWERASAIMSSAGDQPEGLPVSLLPPGASSWTQQGEYRCELCRVSVNTPFQWWQHGTGARHRRAVNHCLGLSEGLTAFCEDCGAYTTQTMEVHQSGARHKKRIAAFSKRQPFSFSASSSPSAAEVSTQSVEAERLDFYFRLEHVMYNSYLRGRAEVMTLLSEREDSLSRKRPRGGSVTSSPGQETVLTLSAEEASRDSGVLPDEWILDSGATISCTFHESDCYDLRPCSVKVRSAGGQQFTVTSRGKLRLLCDRSEFNLSPLRVDTDILGNCLISSRFCRKILALQPLLRDGRTLSAKQDLTVLKDDAGTPLLLAKPRGKLLVVILSAATGSAEEDVYLSVLMSAVKPSRRDLVARILVGHLCMAHVNYREVARVLRLPLPADMPACFVCAIVSPRTEPHDSTSVREPEYVGQMWSMDSKGPYQVPGVRGELYDLVFTELMFGGVLLFPVVSITMDVVFPLWERVYKQHRARFNDKNKVVLVIHDQHLSFNNALFAKHAAVEGYAQSNTATYEHWMNPTERSIQAVIEMKKKNLLQANMPLRMHSEAGKHAAQAQNAGLPTGRCKARVPEEKRNWSRGELMLNRQTAEHGLRSLHPFGCLAVFATALEKARENFVPRGKMSCHLYYEAASHEYVLVSVDGSDFFASFRVRIFPTIFPRRLRSPCNVASLAYESSSALEAVQKEVHSRNDLEALVRHNPGLLDKPRPRPAIEDMTQSSVPQSLPAQEPVAPDAVVPYQSRRRGWNPSAKALANLERDFNVQELNQEGEEVQQFDSSPQPLNVQAMSPRSEAVYHLGAGSTLDPVVQLAAGPLRDKAPETPESAGAEVMGPITPDALERLTPADERSIMSAPGLIGERMRAALREEYEGIKRDCVLGPILRKGDFSDTPLATRIVTRVKGEGYSSVQDIPPENFRARLVARGDRSKDGVHHDSARSSAMVARPESMRLICAMAVDENLGSHATADVRRAFRVPLIDRRIVVALPRTFNPEGDDLRPLNSEQLYAVLLKGLEGTVQGARLFYDDFTKEALSAGLHPTKSDPCLFTNFPPSVVKVEPTSIFFKGAHAGSSLESERNVFAGKVVALLHVDDLLVFSATEVLKNALLSKLGERYSLKISPLRRFLGLDFEVAFTPEKRSIFVSQPAMARTILERAGMARANASPTPLMPGTVLDVAPEERQEVSQEHKDKYRSVVMALNWLSCMTRPSLKFPVAKLSRYISNPAENHIRALTQVLRYLAGTVTKGIRFEWSLSDDSVTAVSTLAARGSGSGSYSDSSHVDDKVASKSTLAYVIFRACGPVSWYSKLSALVSRSPQESEFLALDVLLLELVWILGLQLELGYCGPSGTGTDPEVWAARLRTVFMDNAGTLSCLNDVVRHQANKHYRLRLESVKELIAKYCFVLRKVPGSLNPANPLTKMLSGTQAAIEYSWIESDAQPGGHAKE